VRRAPGTEWCGGANATTPSPQQRTPRDDGRRHSVSWTAPELEEGAGEPQSGCRRGSVGEYPQPLCVLCQASMVARAGAPAIHHLKRCRPKSGVEGSIIAILCPRKPIHPCARLVTCNTAKIHRNDLVNHLRLAIRLRVESCTHAQLHPRHLEEVAPHFASKHGVPVADDGSGELVQPNNAIKESLGD
jgi:hypothetical protein